MHVHPYIAQLNQNKHAGMLCYELQLAACLTMQGLNFAECGATNPVAVEECLYKHAPAGEIWGHAPPSKEN